MERLSEFVPRLLLSLLVAFLLFPLGFVIAHSGLGAEEFLGSVIMMFFIQFISPYQFIFFIVIAAHGIRPGKCCDEKCCYE